MNKYYLEVVDTDTINIMTTENLSDCDKEYHLYFKISRIHFRQGSDEISIDYLPGYYGADNINIPVDMINLFLKVVYVLGEPEERREEIIEGWKQK